MQKYGWLVLVMLLLAGCGGSDRKDSSDTEAQPSLEARPLRPNELETHTVQRVDNINRLTLANGQQIELLGIVSLAEDDPIFAEAKTFTETLVLNKEIGLELGSSERANAYYVWSDQLLVNYEILRAGYGRYQGGRTQYEVFLQYAQEQAQVEQSGLWRSHKLSLRIDLVVANARNNTELNNEWLEIRNEGGETLDLGGFSLRSNSGQVYTFDEGTEITPYGTLTLFTGCGENMFPQYYWCANQSIWGTNETAVLTDENGHYIHHRDILSNLGGYIPTPPNDLDR